MTAEISARKRSNSADNIRDNNSDGHSTAHSSSFSTDSLFPVYHAVRKLGKHIKHFENLVVDVADNGRQDLETFDSFLEKHDKLLKMAVHVPFRVQNSQTSDPDEKAAIARELRQYLTRLQRAQCQAVCYFGRLGNSGSVNRNMQYHNRMEYLQHENSRKHTVDKLEKAIQLINQAIKELTVHVQEEARDHKEYNKLIKRTSGSHADSENSGGSIPPIPVRMGSFRASFRSTASSSGYSRYSHGGSHGGPMQSPSSTDGERRFDFEPIQEQNGTNGEKRKKRKLFRMKRPNNNHNRKVDGAMSLEDLQKARRHAEVMELEKLLPQSPFYAQVSSRPPPESGDNYFDMTALEKTSNRPHGSQSITTAKKKMSLPTMLVHNKHEPYQTRVELANHPSTSQPFGVANNGKTSKNNSLMKSGPNLQDPSCSAKILGLLALGSVICCVLLVGVIIYLVYQAKQAESE